VTERLLVVGGDAGGMTAAAQARRRRPDPEDLDVVVFEKGEFTSYSACGIPYYVGGDVEDASELVARTPEEHRRRGLDVRTGSEVVGIDLDRREVTVLSTGGRPETREPFDRLIVATGATPKRPSIPGIDAAGVHGVQTLTDGIRLRESVDRSPPERAVVVGGGYIGLEMAEALHRRGASVTLVEGSSHPMPTLDADMAGDVADAIRNTGVDLHLGEPVREFEVDGERHVRAVLTEAGRYEADLVVLGLGVVPNSALARDAGIDIGPRGGVTTGPRMETSAEGVFAAGDCVEVIHRVTGQPVAFALGTHANKQGVVAGTNASGGALRYPGVLGTAVSKICAFEVACTGLNERDATAAGFDHFAVTVEATTRAGYFPDAKPIKVKLVCERRTGRLLGAQIVGEEGAAKRIDVLATCLWNEMTVDEMVWIDLSYAPPFSPLWDPVLVAARAAEARLREG
jgi:NADPH-dependent 2,4-dienoyl-CoA reductase/sulfur reductase-like enzyme